MGVAAYAIIGGGGEWRIRHDGRNENVYQSKESAFEAAVAAASISRLKRYIRHKANPKVIHLKTDTAFLVGFSTDTPLRILFVSRSQQSSQS